MPAAVHFLIKACQESAERCAVINQHLQQRHDIAEALVYCLLAGVVCLAIYVGWFLSRRQN